MGTYIEPFDFRTLFVNYFLGSEQLFLYAFVMVLSGVAAKFQLNNKIFFLLLIAGSLIFSMVLGEAIYMLIILLVGVITFKGVSKIVQ